VDTEKLITCKENVTGCGLCTQQKLYPKHGVWCFIHKCYLPTPEVLKEEQEDEQTALLYGGI
jgi:hypothetical protein